jgi:hypothetical protein
MKTVPLAEPDIRKSRENERSPARIQGRSEPCVQPQSGSGSAGLSNGDPEYVMLWGADHSDQGVATDGRR